MYVSGLKSNILTSHSPTFLLSAVGVTHTHTILLMGLSSGGLYFCLPQIKKVNKITFSISRASSTT